MSYTIKPDYYDTFSCIAGDCSFTCCQEWKIAVDPDTFQNWKSVSDPDHHRKLTSYTEIREGERVVRLNPDRACPFLRDDRLCRLVCSYGEDILSETCHIFPRQMHTFSDRTEYSLVSCCPEVIDRWNEREELRFITQAESPSFIDHKPTETKKLCGQNKSGLNAFADENRSENRYSDESAEQADCDHLITHTPSLSSYEETGDFLRNIRNLCMAILADPSASSAENLMRMFYILRDIYDSIPTDVDQSQSDGLSPASKQCSENPGFPEPPFSLSDRYVQSGILSELTRSIRSMPTNPAESFAERNELFLDLADNYRKQGLYTRFLEPAALTAESLEETDHLPDESIRKEIASWEPLFRNFLTSEIYTSLLIPEDPDSAATVRSMVIRAEWIAMEYAAMTHMLYLDALRSQSSSGIPDDTCRTSAPTPAESADTAMTPSCRGMDTASPIPPYNKIRDTMIVVSRMTGYDSDDIEEYMTNSFENAVWDWGYLALILC